MSFRTSLTVALSAVVLLPVSAMAAPPPVVPVPSPELGGAAAVLVPVLVAGWLRRRAKMRRQG